MTLFNCTLQFYKSIGALIRTADFYRLQSPYETNYCTWATIAPDSPEASEYLKGFIEKHKIQIVSMSMKKASNECVEAEAEVILPSDFDISVILELNTDYIKYINI